MNRAEQQTEAFSQVALLGAKLCRCYLRTITIFFPELAHQGATQELLNVPVLT